MKIKNYINKIVAIAAVVALVSGVQFNNAEGKMTTFESTIGIEEAYAGPCGRRGCDGKISDCDGTSYTIFAVGNIEITRYCTGEKATLQESL
tara:strand:+ start:1263 stop:1538 length:276 start_codon:yes stop_codon:yes gene_type:complete